MAKDTKDVSIIEESIVGYEPQKRFFLEATKKFEIIPTEEITKDKKGYKKWFDEKGKIKTQILKNELFVLQGKSADEMWLRGDILNYMEHHKIYTELGYENMRAMFNDPDFPIGETTAYISMAINKRFDRDTAIMLGSKITFLGTFVEELTSEQLDELINQIVKMTYREANEFIKKYRVELLRNKTLLPSDMTDPKKIPVSGKEKTKEYIQVNFNEPKFRTKRDKNGWNSVFNFETDWEQQIWAIAYQNCKSIIKKEIENIINEPGYEKYRKLAFKKYGKE